MDRFLMRLDNESSFAATYQTDIEGSYGHIHLLLFAVGVFPAKDNLEWRSGAGLLFGKTRYFKLKAASEATYQLQRR
jgi:hypothetical protein